MWVCEKLSVCVCVCVKDKICVRVSVREVCERVCAHVRETE